MATVRTGRLLLHFLLGVFLLSLEGGVSSLELLPSASTVVLEHNTSYSVMCSGWSHVTWALPGNAQVEGVVVDIQGSSSILRIDGATWRQSGRYTCSEQDSDQTKDLDLFVPGSGPDQWFLPSPVAAVMRHSLTAVIPCSVSDPDLNVTLWERLGDLRVRVSPDRFDPALGFTARLNDSSYICGASRDQQGALSQVYYVFSVVVQEQVEVELWASSVVVRKGESLRLNCTVSHSEMVFFFWDYPRKHSPDAQELEPLTEFLSGRIRSFIDISETTLADSGVYVCSVQESTQDPTVEKNISVTVLNQGFVSVSPAQTSVQGLVHHTVELSVDIRAFPPPTIIWTTPTSNVTTATTSRISETRFISVLKLEKVQLNQTGNYIATISNDDDIKEVHFTLEVKAPPRIWSLSEVGVASVLCVSVGAPPPKLTWFTCPSSHRCSNVSGAWRNLSESEGVSVKHNLTEIQGLTHVHSVLTLKTLSSVSAVRCEAKNSAGRRAWDLRLVPSSLLAQVKVLAAVLVLVVLAVVFLILLILLWRKKPRFWPGWRLVESTSPDSLQVSYVDPSELLYDSVWEIPRDQVHLGPVVGSGSFGRVVEASVSGLFGPNSSTKATVKTLKRGAAPQSLMSELKLMIQVRPHLNLLNLLGACTRDGPLMLVSEWCRHGDLRNYLQKHKHCCVQSHALNKSESDGYMDMNSEDSHCVALKQLYTQPQEYETLQNTRTSEQQGALHLSDSQDLTLSDLISFSFQTTKAMDFLSSRNCVHRDLAARNILVSEGKLVKVCDMGLARDLSKHQDYVWRRNSFLPVKWMSPESIFHCVNTVQSDVWSYGVLLWEIFSLGETPYSDVPISQFYSELKNGRRLNKPDLAPKEIFDLASCCWEVSPESRPSFSLLVDSVGKLLPDQFHQRYAALTEQFYSNDPAVTRTKTKLGPDSDGGIVPQVTAHLLEAEPQRAGPSHFDDFTPVSDVTMEMSNDTALDADRPDLLDKQEVTSALTSSELESCL